MLTIFSAPKPLRGAFSTIQLNAILSWTHLRPRVEVVLLGEADGIAEVCRRTGAVHVADVPRNEYGTPLISGLFSAAGHVATHPVLCYVNSDVMFTDSLTTAVRRVHGRMDRYLLTGRRYDAPFERPWNFERQDWQEALHTAARQHGRLDSWIAVDYVVFPRGLFADLPPFAVGRTVWDNWLLYHARASGVPLIDATQCVVAVHQRHDYSHHPEGAAGVWKGAEAARNLELAGGARYAFSIADATHVLTEQGALRPAVHPVYLWRRAYSWSVLYPPARPVRAVLDVLLALSKPLRKRIGWTLGPR